MTKRILVVEDNDLNRKLFCDVLLAGGFAVDAACDGFGCAGRGGASGDDRRRTCPGWMVYGGAMRFHIARSSALTPCAFAMRYRVSPLRTVAVAPACAGRLAVAGGGERDADGLRTTVVFAQPASSTAQATAAMSVFNPGLRAASMLTIRPSAAVRARPARRR